MSLSLPRVLALNAFRKKYPLAKTYPAPPSIESSQESAASRWPMVCTPIFLKLNARL